MSLPAICCLSLEYDHLRAYTGCKGECHNNDANDWKTALMRVKERWRHPPNFSPGWSQSSLCRRQCEAGWWQEAEKPQKKVYMTQPLRQYVAEPIVLRSVLEASSHLFHRLLCSIWKAKALTTWRARSTILSCNAGLVANSIPTCNGAMQHVTARGPPAEGR